MTLHFLQQRYNELDQVAQLQHQKLENLKHIGAECTRYTDQLEGALATYFSLMQKVASQEIVYRESPQIQKLSPEQKRAFTFGLQKIEEILTAQNTVQMMVSLLEAVQQQDMIVAQLSAKLIKLEAAVQERGQLIDKVARMVQKITDLVNRLLELFKQHRKKTVLVCAEQAALTEARQLTQDVAAQVLMQPVS